jgi:formylglycine-generating enzyme required for sulfatase activity
MIVYAAGQSPRRCAAVWSAVILLALCPATASAQQAPGARFTIARLISSLEAGVSVPRLVTLVIDGCVVDGPPTDAQAATLRRLGATSALFKAIEASPCATQAPARPSAAAPLGEGFGAEQFARIPAGTYQMGSATGEADERPARTVTISRPFLLQRTEVTQGQWTAVMGSNPSDFTACGPTCPVERVSWDDVQRFLARLNAQEPGKGYRLPTEAEWEYAARAGTTGDYGGTGVLDQMGWYDLNSGGQTHAVGGKAPNAWGLYDLHGNVWEWVADWYGGYAGAARTDPVGPANGNHRVLRGGSWGSTAVYARSAYRSNGSPDFRYDSGFGFRLARTP